MTNQPISSGEMARIVALSDLNAAHFQLENSFTDLAKLAARAADAPYALINLADPATLWTISSYGLEQKAVPLEDSVCQYTIQEQDYFEVVDFSADERFKDKAFVTEGLQLRYYYGIPLKDEGRNIGALCVMDRQKRSITGEQAELLKIISEEVIKQLKSCKYTEALRSNMSDTRCDRNSILHDLRGPLSGILGLAQIISEQGYNNDMEEVLDFMSLIHKSGTTLMELADEILSADKKRNTPIKTGELNLVTLKEKLEYLYAPLARNKNILFKIHISSDNETLAFAQAKLLQITGNLISNAIKFTPRFGSITIDLEIKVAEESRTLKVLIKDTGIGLTQADISNILHDTEVANYTSGTEGEQGFGFGLKLVRQLVHGLNGTINITSIWGGGAAFEVVLPM